MALGRPTRRDENRYRYFSYEQPKQAELLKELFDSPTNSTVIHVGRRGGRTYGTMRVRPDTLHRLQGNISWGDLVIIEDIGTKRLNLRKRG